MRNGISLRDMSQNLSRSFGTQHQRANQDNPDLSPTLNSRLKDRFVHFHADIRNLTESRLRLQDAELSFRDLLSSRNQQPLSIQLSEDRLLTERVPCVERTFDIDSVVMQLTSLAAFPDDDFALAYTSPYSSVMARNLHISYDGQTAPHKTPNMALGHYGNTQRRVHIFFPRIQRRVSDSNRLTEDQLNMVFEEIIQAIKQCCPTATQQQHPGSYDQARAKATTHRTRVNPSQTREAGLLCYTIPSASTAEFWTILSARLSSHHSNQFGSHYLLFQAHNLKDQTSAPTATGAITSFKRKFLQKANHEFIVPSRCWVDLGFRDTPSFPDLAFGDTSMRQPFTFLYKTSCLAHLGSRHAKGNETRALDGFQTAKYSQYLLRDISSLELIQASRSPRNPLAGALRQIKAYNSYKEQLYSPDKDFSPFQSAQLTGMVLGPDQFPTWIQTQRKPSPGTNNRPYEALATSFQNNKKNVLDSLAFSCREQYKDFGVRRECRVPLLHVERFDFSQLPGSTGGVRPFRNENDDDAHNPFFALSTLELNDMILNSAGRFVVALERLHASAQPHPADPGMTFSHKAQYQHLRTSSTLHALLRHSLCGSSIFVERWIWQKNFRLRRSRPARDEGSPDPDAEGRGHGLGLDAIYNQFGMVFFPDTSFDWAVPELQPAVAQQLAFPKHLFRPALGLDQSRHDRVGLARHMHDIRHERFQAMLEEGISDHEILKRRHTAFIPCLEFIVQAYNRELLEAHKPMVKKVPGITAQQAERICRSRQDAPYDHLDILSVADIFAIFLDVVACLGEHKSIELDDKLLFPCLVRTRAPRNAEDAELDAYGCRSWSFHVARMLHGLNNTASWKSKAFVTAWWEIENNWLEITQYTSHHLFRKSDWRTFCNLYAGSLIHVTPNFERTKFLTAQSHRVRSSAFQHIPLFSLGYCCPAIRVPLLAESLLQKLSYLSIWASLSVRDPRPDWLNRRALNAMFHGLGVSLDTRLPSSERAKLALRCLNYIISRDTTANVIQSLPTFRLRNAPPVAVARSSLRVALKENHRADSAVLSDNAAGLLCCPAIFTRRDNTEPYPDPIGLHHAFGRDWGLDSAARLLEAYSEADLGLQSSLETLYSDIEQYFEDRGGEGDGEDDAGTGSEGGTGRRPGESDESGSDDSTFGF